MIVVLLASPLTESDILHKKESKLKLNRCRVLPSLNAAARKVSKSLMHSQPAAFSLKWRRRVPILAAIDDVKLLTIIMTLLVATASASWANGGENFPFHVGEKLIYQIYWGPLVVGRASLEVDGIEQIDGHDCYHIVAQAKTSGLVNFLYPIENLSESWLDVKGLFTRKYRQNRTEGKRHRNDETSYDYERKEVIITDFKKKKEKRVRLDSPVLDVISSLYYVRTQPLKLDAENSLTVNTGDTNYAVRFRPDERKNLWIRPVGDVTALRIEPDPTLRVVAANKGRMWFWVSDDARHFPLIVASNMQIGSAKLVLYKVESSNPATDKALRSKRSPIVDKKPTSTDALAANK